MSEGRNTTAWIGFAGTVLAALIGAGVVIASRDGGGGNGTGSGDPPPPSSSVALPTTTEMTTAQLFLNRDSGPGGAAVLLSGRGFEGGERVVFWFHTEQIGSTTTSDEGTFSGVSVTIPRSFSNFAPQQFAVRGTGENSIKSAQAPFTITG